MIDFLQGKVMELGEESVVLSVNGVGFRLSVPSRTVATLSLGEEAKLYTHLLLSEDEFSLYGFATPEEREMFVTLLSVPQVGPRLAFKLVAALPPVEFVAAIRRGDLSALDAVKGIGRRTAQRVLLELSERVQKWAPEEAPPPSEKERKSCFRPSLPRPLGSKWRRPAGPWNLCGRNARTLPWKNSSAAPFPSSPAHEGLGVGCGRKTDWDS